MATEVRQNNPYKNQDSTVISCRVNNEVLSVFRRYCLKHNKNFNSGLKKLILTHPDTLNNG